VIQQIWKWKNIYNRWNLKGIIYYLVLKNNGDFAAGRSGSRVVTITQSFFTIMQITVGFKNMFGRSLMKMGIHSQIKELSRRMFFIISIFLTKLRLSRTLSNTIEHYYPEVKVTGVFPRMINDDESCSLYIPVTMEELRAILSLFKKDKILGPDGWTIKFFTFYLVGEDLLEMVEE
jgi:hypothetical protein